MRPEDWGRLYATERRKYLGLTPALELLFPKLMEKEEIPFAQIEGRTKDVPNFISKLRRKSYNDPLVEVTDFSGIRIVLFYLDDVERVGEMIQRNFALDEDHSVDKRALMDPDRFGYQSVHHVVQLSPERAALPEWSEFADLSAEIQIRTVLQHAWGAISRKLAYASVREAPRDLQRSLNRLSALLELADEQFLDIRNARKEIEQQYDREVERGNLDLAVDESSLDIYLRESGVADRITEVVEEAGSPTAPPLTEEEAHEEMRDLLTILDRLGITRIAELDERVRSLWSKLPNFFSLVNQGFVEWEGGPLRAYHKNWLALALLWDAEASPEDFQVVRYIDPLIHLIRATYDPDLAS